MTTPTEPGAQAASCMCGDPECHIWLEHGYSTPARTDDAGSAGEVELTEVEVLSLREPTDDDRRVAENIYKDQRDRGAFSTNEVAKLIASYRAMLILANPQPSGQAMQMAGRWAGVPELVDKITAEEGATVTFTGPNPDFNGLPNEAVTVCSGDDWQDVTYRADTLADCLRAALQSGEGKA